MELILFGGLSVILFFRPRTNESNTGTISARPQKKASLLTRILVTCVVVTLLTRITRFVFVSINHPFGDQDALITWNLRARFLFWGPNNWRDYFTEKLSTSSQPDYPLLLPSSIARFWSYLGTDPQFVPIGIALVLTFSIIGLAYASITILRGQTQGLLATLVLLGTPFLIEHGATQYADIPLTFYFFSALVLICLYDAGKGTNHRLIMLAGMMAGFAIWTKNEGGLFLILIFLIRCLTVGFRQSWKMYFYETKYFFQGLLPILLITLLFKTQIAPAAILFISQGLDPILSKLQDPTNYLEVGLALTKKLFRFGHPGIVLLIIYGFLLGVRNFSSSWFPVHTPTFVLFGMILGYLSVIITTPFHSVSFQIATSLDRLWIQLWPGIILVIFFIIRTPEEALDEYQSTHYLNPTSQSKTQDMLPGLNI